MRSTDYLRRLRMRNANSRTITLSKVWSTWTRYMTGKLSWHNKCKIIFIYATWYPGLSWDPEDASCPGTPTKGCDIIRGLHSARNWCPFEPGWWSLHFGQWNPPWWKVRFIVQYIACHLCPFGMENKNPRLTYATYSLSSGIIQSLRSLIQRDSPRRTKPRDTRTSYTLYSH